jgi:hypothetical protein
MYCKNSARYSVYVVDCSVGAFPCSCENSDVENCENDPCKALLNVSVACLRLDINLRTGATQFSALPLTPCVRAMTTGGTGADL